MEKEKINPGNNRKYRFLSKEESDRLKKIMVWAGGYTLFVEKWMEYEKPLPIPTQNTYYNVINGRSLKRDVLEIIQKVVDETKVELEKLKDSLKEN